ncbi:NUDIX hydrolase [Pseudomonas neustonica]|uniref:GDP-mannose pyrophosphatase n=1 Tax=Pseudomonas neustonica TaxID=2487346 RepID=A0ABX9XI01_9PSED|nr:MULTISPECIES: NUDIX hydrolase [Pseudomonas]ROZ81395.1 NUDIX hydrolase [Pseudomonas sp. SSM44]ROZ82683.1 NUDIX hydrolase [Pseudomonas neustonica]|tara:strand:+ start:5763 stop:6260 length:498 start_codon:yes stop_codon:yes gene_type:complete
MSTVYENPWFKVVRENGFHWVEENGASNGAAILAVLDGHSALLVWVQRPAQGERMLEIPRGYGEPGESSLQCACRELQEETGYRAAPEQLTRLGRYRPNSAILTSCVDLYLAELTSSDQVGRPDREVLAVEEVPLGSLPAKLQDGILDDGFTLAALAHYYARAQA